MLWGCELKRFLTFSVILCAPIVALAGGVGPQPPVYSSNSDATALIGIQVDLTDLHPQLVGGIRYTHTNTNNVVSGAKADIAIPLVTGKPSAPTFRLMGLIGNPNAQAEAGLGFDLLTSQPVLAVGGQGPYVNGGANIGLGGKLTPYVGVNSLDGAPKRNVTIVTIPSPC